MIHKIISVLLLTTTHFCAAGDRMQVDCCQQPSRPNRYTAGCKRSSEYGHKRQASPAERLAERTVTGLGERFALLLENNNPHEYAEFLTDCTVALSFYEQFAGEKTKEALVCAQLRLMQHVATQRNPYKAQLFTYQK